MPGTHYETLGLKPGTLVQDIRAAFKRRALSVHPDKGGSKEAFQDVLRAFEVLSNPAHRACYDAQLSSIAEVVMKKKEATAASSRNKPACNNDKMLRTKRASGSDEIPAAGDSSKACIFSTSKRRALKKHPSVLAEESVLTAIGASHAEIPISPLESRYKRKLCGATLETRRAKLQQASQKEPHGQASSCAVNMPSHARKTQQSKGVEQSGFICLLHTLLQQLSPARRREVLQQELNEIERRALEAWIVACRFEQPRERITVQALLATRDDNSSNDEESVDSDLDSRANSHFCQGLLDSASEKCLAIQDSSAFPLQDTSPCSYHDEDEKNEEKVEEDDMDSVCLHEEDDEVNEVCDQTPLQTEDESGELDAPELQGMEDKWDRRARAKGNVRGITRRDRGGKHRYCVSVGIHNLRISTREVDGLARALDFLMILTAIKHSISAGADETFRDRFRDAVASTLSEHGVALKDIGLGFRVELEMQAWLGRHFMLKTPVVHDLDLALTSWELLNEVRVRKKGHPTILQRWHRLGNWSRLRSAYLHIVMLCGQCPERAASWIDRIYRASGNHREQQMEQWNRHAMALEEKAMRKALAQTTRDAARVARAMEVNQLRLERMNRKAMVDEERRQRRAIALELRLQAWNHRAMGAEEKLQRRGIAWEHRISMHSRKAMNREDRVIHRGSYRRPTENRIVHRICLCLNRWRRKEARFKAHVMESHKTGERLAARQARRELQGERAIKKARWKWLNRRDITMADLLGPSNHLHEHSVCSEAKCATIQL